jgi:hypothetical protein
MVVDFPKRVVHGGMKAAAGKNLKNVLDFSASVNPTPPVDWHVDPAILLCILMIRIPVQGTHWIGLSRSPTRSA